MRRQGQRHLVPLDQDVRVMVGLLSEARRAADENYRVLEVLPLNRPGDLTVFYGPAGRLSQFGRDLVICEKLHVTGIPFGRAWIIIEPPRGAQRTPPHAPARGARAARGNTDRFR